jgi:hypothetical protein
MQDYLQFKEDIITNWDDGDIIEIQYPAHLR